MSFIKPVRKGLQEERSSKHQFSKTGSKKFSFPRASRFLHPKENDDPQMLILPSTLSKKSCTFGLGRRLELKSRHCQDSPSPGNYLLRSCFNEFNHSLDYKKQSVKERKLFYIKPVPGPGSYNPSTPEKKRSPNCFIIGKKSLNQGSSTPDPGRYNPNYTIGQKHVAYNISFSRASRTSFLDKHVERSSSPSIKMIYGKAKTAGHSPRYERSIEDDRLY